MNLMVQVKSYSTLSRLVLYFVTLIKLPFQIFAILFYIFTRLNWHWLIKISSISAACILHISNFLNTSQSKKIIKQDTERCKKIYCNFPIFINPVCFIFAFSLIKCELSSSNSVCSQAKNQKSFVFKNNLGKARWSWRSQQFQHANTHAAVDEIFNGHEERTSNLKCKSFYIN